MNVRSRPWRFLAAALVLPGVASAQLHVYDAGTAGSPAVPDSPEQQGWSLRSTGSAFSVLPIADDGGLNAWAISDGSGPGVYGYAYYHATSSQVTNAVIGDPWELTVTMKLAAGPEASFFIEVNSGFTFIHTGYRVFFRIVGADVWIEDAYGTHLFTCAGAADDEYHQFSLRKVDSVLYGPAEVLYDGARLGTVGEDWPGSYAFDLGPKFGTWADHGRARARVHRIEFRALDDLGDPRCAPAVPNSTGVPGELFAVGSPYVNQNLLEVVATSLPANALGYLIASRTPGFAANPGGSQGNLCLGGSIGRFAAQAQSSGPAGSITTPVDLTRIPGIPPSAAQAGETWIFQLWHRDANPASTSNFTHALDVTFR